MVVCPRCSSEIEKKYRFCLKCGASLKGAKCKPAETEAEAPKSLDCPDCQASVPSHSKFCLTCGSEVAQKQDSDRLESTEPW